MQDAVSNPHWINLLISGLSLLLGGGLLGVFVKGLFDRKEQQARTGKIKAETAKDQAESYQAFSESMRMMRQDVDEAEAKIRAAKKEREKLEKQIHDLILSSHAKDRDRDILRCARDEAIRKIGELETEIKRLKKL